MKKITNLFIAILFVANLWAQAPQKMSYQAVVRNAENNLVVNQSIGMQISILQGSEDGTVVYAETQKTTSNANGLVSLQIGEGTVVEGDLSTINWQNGPFFIKTETDPMGGTNYSISGVSELLSVPFALHAATAQTVENVEMDGTATAFEGWDKNAADDFDGDYNSLSNKPDLSTIDTKLSETEVDEMVANNGYLSSFTEEDGDITNEIQDLKLEGNTLTITNNGAATKIDLSKYLDNADTKLTETEVDEMVANNGYLTSFTEVDGDASNEIQDLKLEGNILKITNNGTATEIDLSKYLDNTNTQLSETEVDAFVSNNGYAADVDLHAVAKSGNYADLENTPVLWDSTYASIKGVPTNVSTFTNDAGYQLATDDEDVSATNEIQTISRTDLTVTLTDGGTFTDSVLTETEVDAFVANNGYASQTELDDSVANLKTALADSIVEIRNDIPDVKTYQIGDFAHGGIVFWVDESGQHGLVCAKEDQSEGVRWHAGTYGTTRANGDGPYAGKMNTLIIIAAHVAIGDDGNTYAARICNELQITENGKTYGDWYLPSQGELSLMYNNRSTINTVATENGGSAIDLSGNYWSSNENTRYSTDNYANYLCFSNGKQFYTHKYKTVIRLRAIRAF